MDDREVEDPQDDEEKRVLAAEQEGDREDEADEADGPQDRVGGAPPKEGRPGPEVVDRPHRRDAVGADERDELGDRAGERGDEHEAEDAEDDEAGEDVVARGPLADEDAMEPRHDALAGCLQLARVGLHRRGG
ncbi:hypothetical protein [Nannocystis sp. ILAH1]|uniref:hypothetical protein n=1 Tax=Nannocystis sp. ILAH1 TaxID=2996789 RepID=UPI003209D644